MLHLSAVCMRDEKRRQLLFDRIRTGARFTDRPMAIIILTMHVQRWVHHHVSIDNVLVVLALG